MDYIMEPLEVALENIGSQACFVCPSYVEGCPMLYSSALIPIS